MKRSFKKWASVILALCLLLTSVTAAVAEDETEVMPEEAAAEETVSQETVQEAPAAPEEPVKEEPKDTASDGNQDVAVQQDENKPAEQEKPADKQNEEEQAEEETTQPENNQEENTADDPAAQTGEAPAPEGSETEENQEDIPDEENKEQGDAAQPENDQEENPADDPAATEDAEPEEDEKEEESNSEEAEPEESEEETGDEEELDIDSEEEDLLAAVDGDVILSTGVTSTVNIAAQPSARSYASYTMTEAGLLTLTFKSVGTAHGNVNLSVRSEDGSMLWAKMWATSTGTINFSDFVEKGEYSILMEKSDSTDESSYTLALTPIVTRQGELGTNNKTRTSAATLTLGSTATGIFSYQDLYITSDPDYYKFVLSEPGWVTVNYTNKTTSAMVFEIFGDDPDTQLYGMTLAVPAAADNTETNTTTRNRTGLLDAGTYYIRTASGATGRYTLTVSNNPVSITEKEKDNSFMLAYNSGNRLQLSGSPVTGLLSESDGDDCYVFHLDKTTLVDFDLKIQFTDVDVGVFTRENILVTGGDFSKYGTSGAQGNPYELEKRDLRLDAGDYYVWVQKHNDKTGLYEIYAKSRITASSLDVKIEGSAAKISASSSPSSITPTKSYIHVFVEDSGNVYPVADYEYTNQSSSSVTYTIPEKGHYLVQYVVTDGTKWDEKWTEFNYEGKEFAILSISAVPDENGKITCSATYSGNGSLKQSHATLYKGTEIVDEKDLGGATNWTLNAPVSGDYAIQFSATLSGAIWKDGWVNVKVDKKEILPLKVDTLSVSSDSSGNITCVATTKDGYPLKNVNFTLYSGSSIVATQLSNKLTAKFKVNTSGTYTVQCAAYDGDIWADKWTTASVTVSGSSPLTVSSLTASVDGNGLISMNASTSGGKGVKQSFFEIYFGGSVVSTVNTTDGKGTYQALQNGTHTIHYVATDGTTWAESWYSVTVSITDLAPTITSLTATANTAGAITISCDYTSKRGVVWLDYNIFNSSSEQIVHHRTTGTKTATRYVTESGTYIIQVVLYDGQVWADKWTSVAVTVSGSGAVDVSITALTVKRTSISSIEAEGTINDERALSVSKMYLHQNGKVVAEQNAPNKKAAFSGLAAGNYNVQYVVYDGKKWVDRWEAVTVGTTTLTVNTFTVTRSINDYSCSATVTNELDIQTAFMIAYNTSNEEIARWTWSGSGDYLNHVFTIDPTANINCIQYVVYDGVQWVDGWMNVSGL